MQMFPERAAQRDRRLLPTALAISLLLHLLGGGLWLLYDARLAPVIAKLLPRPTPTPEIVALSDAITIEKRVVPRAARRSPDRPHQAPLRTRPQPRRIAQRPALQAPPVPTLAPLPTRAPTVAPTAPPTAAPTAAPTAVPTYRARRATLHHPRPAPTVAAQRLAAAPPRVVVPPPPPQQQPAASRNAFSPQQIAALDKQFAHTIAAARRSLTDVPPQRRPPANTAQAKRYEAIMAGSPEQFLAAQGECASIQGAMVHGNIVDRYLRCLITYSDGYFEEVSFPYPYHFTRRGDPFQFSDPENHPFPMQAPPPGFVPPHPFALSRALCSFYRAECASLIARERANGNQPVTAAP